MVSRQRRERERNGLRQQILQAARDIARQDGWKSVTLRKVSEAIEYSHPAIYAYFDSKEAILLELLREGFALLTRDLRAARISTQSPFEQLHQVALAYWHFSRRAPELYQVMHGLDGVPFGTETTLDEAKAAFAELRDSVQATLDALGVTVPELNAEVDILWATLHGLVALAASGRLAGDESRAIAIVERAIHNLIQAWKPLATSQSMLPT